MGVRVVGHWEVLPELADDAEYLGLCAAQGWIPLTADADVHNKANQKILIRRAKLQVFRLARNHWPWRDKVAAFVAALPAIEKLLNQPGPFIARINRTGRIYTVEDLRDQED